MGNDLSWWTGSYRRDAYRPASTKAGGGAGVAILMNTDTPTGAGLRAILMIIDAFNARNRRDEYRPVDQFTEVDDAEEGTGTMYCRKGRNGQVFKSANAVELNFYRHTATKKIMW